MKIAVIGAGNVGGALALQLTKAGHHLIIGTRSPQGEDIKNLLQVNPALEIRSVAEAAQQAEVILIAAVPKAVREISAQFGDVSQKVIIDAMNSINTKVEDFANTFEALKAWTNCRDIAKCFNTTGYENMANPVYDNQGIDMFVAGSSAKAKEVARQLSKEIGFAECYDFGGDDKVHLLEQFAFSWINLAIMQGHGRNIAFKLIRR